MKKLKEKNRAVTTDRIKSKENVERKPGEDPGGQPTKKRVKKRTFRP